VEVIRVQRNRYWHDPESFRRIWNSVKKETGLKWSCELKTCEEIGWDPKDVEYLGEDSRVIQFVVSQTDYATVTS